MASLRRWLDERMDLAGVSRALLDREVPDRLTWWHTLGSATLAVFLVQIVTGVVLATYYAPSPDHAYDSVQFIQRQVTSGSLLRGIHHWGSSAMVVLVLAHMIRVFSMGAYKYPREPNWVLGAVMFLIVLGFGFTGYLLPWDQRAYWATQVGTSIAGTAPVVGATLTALLRGGAQLGAATLTRFYAFHVLWLPLLLGVFVLVHLALVVRQGIAPRTAALEAGAPPRTSDPTYVAYYKAAYAATKRSGVRFWPDIVGKDLIVSFAVIAALVLLALAFGASLESPADPTDNAYVPRPEWYFLPFYELLKLFPGSLESTIAVGVPLLLVFALLALPFFDTRSRRSLRRRPVALASLGVLLGGSALLLGSALRGAQPRVAPESGLPLTSNQRAGRALFERQCASCHVVAGLAASEKREKSEKEGPKLTDVGLRHSVAWLHSFIEDPDRFRGDTASMAAFGPPVLSHQEIEEVAQYLTTLRGPPGSNLKPDIQDTFPEPKKPEQAGTASGGPSRVAQRVRTRRM
ncbi:MAG TPA: cytochrome b N-terminal domain-containing protein [Gemmatimonadaceae bacterium]|nr:cytochrome b N-terminal domain-containing protein [Gemmatimonadaceae bacterium]